jgi:hypothetical protein
VRFRIVINLTVQHTGLTLALAVCRRKSEGAREREVSFGRSTAPTSVKPLLVSDAIVISSRVRETANGVRWSGENERENEIGRDRDGLDLSSSLLLIYD